MATTTSAAAGFQNLVNMAIQRDLEANLRAQLHFASPGAFDHYIHKPGTNVMRRGYVGDLAVDLVNDVLVEGTPNTATTLVIDNDSITAKQYGKLVSLTDLTAFMSPYDLAATATERVTRWVSELLDRLTVSVIDTYAVSSLVLYSGSATSRATVAAKLTGKDIHTLVGYARNANVQPFDDGFYRLVVHPRIAIDVGTNDTASYGSFEQAVKYDDATPLIAGEIGTFAGCKILETTICTSFATAGAGSVDVIRSYLLGKGALGIGDVSTMEVICTPPGGHGDEFHQIMSLAAKAWLGCKVQIASGTRVFVAESSGTILAAGQH